MLSLIDRLFDDAPDQADDALQRPGILEARERQALCRDLEQLLNTRRPFSSWVERVVDTVVGYGMPDITTEDFSSNEVRERVGRQIELCLGRHEPRLEYVRVTFDEAAEPGQDVRFVIHARIQGGDDQDEPVSFGGRFTSIDRIIAIEAA